jgi:hypothetical protein
MTPFEEFLKSEYENIAGAHFRALQTITSFFRYFLLLASIPVSAIVLLLKQEGRVASDELIRRFQFPAYFGLLLISVAGFLVFLYVVNIRFDAVLYARVINGIRKYHFDRSGIPPWEQTRLRGLPQTTALPHYFEGSFFLPVVVVFGLVNSMYMLGAVYVANFLRVDFLMWSGFLTMLLLHVLVYARLAEHRERAYLRSNIIGVDVDGVLNNHRTTFTEVLGYLTGRYIDPQSITHIPVHENAALRVAREDERKVFNQPLYWITQTPASDAQRVLAQARNILRLKVYLFTHRPWPDAQQRGELAVLKRSFHDACWAPSLWSSIACRLAPLRTNPIVYVTKDWLKRCQFAYDRLVVERGNDYSPDPLGHTNNRFHHARKTKMRYFVEDDVEKAAKLAYICDFVFLIEQPYNMPNPDMPQHLLDLIDAMPNNVVRVRDWNDIWRQLKRLA